MALEFKMAYAVCDNRWCSSERPFAFLAGEFLLFKNFEIGEVVAEAASAVDKAVAEASVRP